LTQQAFTSGGQGLHGCLVLAHQVEQSAHLPRCILRPPTFLVRVEGSTRACVFPPSWWNLKQMLSALVEFDQGADARTS
jgi:hypothetical protein